MFRYLTIAIFSLLLTGSAFATRTLYCHTGGATVAEGTRNILVSHSISSFSFDPANAKGGLKGTLRLFIKSKKTGVLVAPDFSNLKHGECGFMDTAMLATDPATIVFNHDVLVSVNSQTDSAVTTTLFFSDLGSQFFYDAVYAIPVDMGTGQFTAENSLVKKVK